MYVEDESLQEENDRGAGNFTIMLGGYFDRMKEAQEIFGKRIYNQDFQAEDRQIHVRLIIE